MGIAYDPRRIVDNVVSGLAATPLPIPATIKKDNEVTDASVIVLWEGGPETLKYLFFSAPAPGPYDVVVTVGDPRSTSERPVQDRPVHYQMRFPVTVTTTDKYNVAGAVVCTAARMQYKVTYALRFLIETDAQSVGVTPARTMRIITDEAKHKRVGGIDIWEANHFVEYETGYGWW